MQITSIVSLHPDTTNAISSCHLNKEFIVCVKVGRPVISILELSESILHFFYLWHILDTRSVFHASCCLFSITAVVIAFIKLVDTAWRISTRCRLKISSLPRNCLSSYTRMQIAEPKPRFKIINKTCVATSFLYVSLWMMRIKQQGTSLMDRPLVCTTMPTGYPGHVIPDLSQFK